MIAPVDVAAAPIDAVEIDVAWAGLTLAGTAYLPAGAGPHPLMVMIQGSGAADRECEGYFGDVRAAFVSRGIATCAVDKPGCGASTGDWREHGLVDRAAQAAAVIDHVRRHPEIDADRVGVWGQSQGGWIVQRLAAEGHGLACAIANSGPSIGVAEQDLYATEHTMRRDGFGDADIARAVALMQRVHDAARSDTPFDTVARELLEPVADEPWNRLGLGDADAADWALMRRFLAEDHRPVEVLRRVELPFLAVFGGLDVLLPAWRSAAEVGTALAAAGSNDATVTVYPSGDHRIRVASGAFAPGYLDLLGDWAAARLRSAG